MDEKKFDDYKKELNYYLNGCVADKELERAVEAELNKTGIYYRIFSRTKAPQSAWKGYAGYNCRKNRIILSG